MYTVLTLSSSLIFHCNSQLFLQEYILFSPENPSKYFKCISDTTNLDLSILKACVKDKSNEAQFFTTKYPVLTTFLKKAFENIVGKGENAGHQHFFLFPLCFLFYQKQIPSFKAHLTHSHTMTPFDAPRKQTF